MTSSMLGQIIDGKYCILSVLGRGGFGHVYLAEQIDLQRQVALKIMEHFPLSRAENIARFNREAKILSALSHPGIVQLYSYGVDERHAPYFVMECVTGKTLRQVLDTQRLTWQQVQSIGMQACRALQAAHEHGSIHRDLKPENIMISHVPSTAPGDDGLAVTILDFGLASISTAEVTLQKLTSTGELMGTPAYFSPEICRGEKPESRSDIYSLGCILYECLAGRPAFINDEPLALIFQHASEMPQRLKSGEAPAIEFPPEFELVVFKALQKPLEHRFQTMSEFERALSSIGQGLDALPFSSPELTSATKQKSDRPAIKFVAISAIVVLLLVTLAAIAFKQSRNSVEENGQSEQTAGESSVHKDLNTAETYIDTGDYLKAAPILVALRKQPLSTADATRLAEDLCTISFFVTRDGLPDDTPFLPPKVLHQRNEVLFLTLAADPLQNTPSDFPLSKIRILLRGLQRQRGKPTLGNLTAQEASYCQAMNAETAAWLLLGRYCTLEIEVFPKAVPQIFAEQEHAVEYAKKSDNTALLLKELCLLADYYETFGDGAKAATVCRAIDGLLPESLKASDRDMSCTLLLVAQRYIERNQLEKAQACLQRTMQIWATKRGSIRDMYDYYRDLAALRARQKRFDEAIKYLRLSLPYSEKLELASVLPGRTYSQIADCYSRSHQHELAADALRSAVKSLIECSDGLYGLNHKLDELVHTRLKLAAEYRALGKSALAEKELRAALGECQRNHNTHTQTLNALNSYHQTSADMIRIYLLLGMRQDAEKTANNQIALIENDASGSMQLAQAYADRALVDPDSDRALKDLQEAYRLSIKNGHSIVDAQQSETIEARLGIYYARRGRYNEAQPILKHVESLSVWPDWRDRQEYARYVPFALANSYAHLGDRKQAEEIYRRIVPSLMPDELKEDSSIAEAKQTWERYGKDSSS